MFVCEKRELIQWGTLLKFVYIFTWNGENFNEIHNNINAFKSATEIKCVYDPQRKGPAHV